MREIKISSAGIEYASAAQSWGGGVVGRWGQMLILVKMRSCLFHCSSSSSQLGQKFAAADAVRA